MNASRFMRSRAEVVAFEEAMAEFANASRTFPKPSYTSATGEAREAIASRTFIIYRKALH